MFEWGWVVEPDPDFQLSVFTCDQRSYEDGGEIAGGLVGQLLLQPGLRRALREAEDDPRPGGRGPTVVKQAQKMLYDDAAYSMTYYYNNLEAYRSDRFTGLVRQPTDGGSLVFQCGTYTYRSIDAGQPSSQEADSASLGLWLGVAGGAVVLAGAAVG